MGIIAIRAQALILSLAQFSGFGILIVYYKRKCLSILCKTNKVLGRKPIKEKA
jgi:hypothetical protein